jgi:hypothetical protein
MAARTATHTRLYPFVRPALVDGAAGAVVAAAGRVFSASGLRRPERVGRPDGRSARARSSGQLNPSLPPVADKTPELKRTFRAIGAL